MSDTFIFIPEFDISDLTSFPKEKLNSFNNFNSFVSTYVPSNLSELPLESEEEYFAFVEFLGRWGDHVIVLMDGFKGYFISALKGKRFAISSVGVKSRIKRDISLIASCKEIKSAELKKFFLFAFESALTVSHIIDLIDRYFHYETTSSGAHEDRFFLRFYDEKGQERGEIYASGVWLYFHSFFHKIRIIDYLHRQLPFLVSILMCPIVELPPPYNNLLFEIRNYIIDKLGDLLASLLENLVKFRFVWKALSKHNNGVFTKITTQRLVEIENYFVCWLGMKQNGYLVPRRRIETFGWKDMEAFVAAIREVGKKFMPEHRLRIFLVGPRIEFLGDDVDQEITDFLNPFSLNYGAPYLRCECGNIDPKLFIIKTGEVICKSCGLVVDQEFR